MSRVPFHARAALLSILLLAGCSGERPVTGLVDGRLRPCPDTPNCVCSDAADEAHAIAPLQADLQTIFELLAGMERVTIVTHTDTYLYAEFTSRVFRFVDDVEFHADGRGTVHVRSASRLGYSDMGVNRKRIETIRAALTR